MKTARFLFGFVVTTLFLLTACGGSAPTEPAPVEQLPVTGSTVAPATVEPTNTIEPPTPEPTQPQYAPFCDRPPAGCEAPTVEMLDNKYCISKVPYAIMSVPFDTTYESLDLDLQCVDQMHSDGSLRVTCHSVTGKELWSYDLKVCNGSCSAPALQMGTGQCPEGYGYDPTSMCCAAPSPASGDGCTTYTVDLGACPQPK
ncbi:MAG: hypothetical protein AB8I58_13120 [Anaerolineales bacterium]|jgi:hypothetical protein